MSMTIALAGNPNCGKTTMFNDLTGSSQYVGNWPGVTVEKKEGKLKKQKDVTIVDLPGIYSLSPYTLEEVVSRNYLLDEKPDAIINLVDGTNLERNLYLTTQILEIGIPTVVALNMIDLVNKSGDKINVEKLSKELGCPVVKTSALKGDGLKEVVEKAKSIAGKSARKVNHSFSSKVEAALSEISDLIGSKAKENARFCSIKLFERDEKLSEKMKLDSATSTKIEEIIVKTEKELDDDSESIITNERYDWISKTIHKCMSKKTTAMSISDKVDKVVTNRILALPIFIAVMFIVYYVSISTIGTAMTDWVNEGLFGDGFYLFGNGRGEYEDSVGEFDEAQAGIEAYIAAAEEAGVDVEAVNEALAFDPEEYEDEAELAAAEAEADSAITDFMAEAEPLNIVTTGELEDEDGNKTKIENVDDAFFEQALGVEEPDPASFGIWVPGIPELITMGLDAVGAADWVQSLLVDGIVAGVGAILGFLPQMMVLFIFLAILEDCGYMARIAFIMDRIFRKFGLSGKSFIPMLISAGCGVPGIMGTKTIENEKDRRMTIITTTFVPCGAKLPIIALIVGAMFGTEVGGVVGALFYFLGVAAVIISGIMLKKTKMFAGDPAPFVMELPQYHLPKVKGVFIHMWERSKAFVKKAGTVIFVSSVVIWFLSRFGMSNGSFGLLDEEMLNDSLLANIGNMFAWIFAPLGFGNWRATVATITGLVAKENVVSTFGILLNLGGDIGETDAALWAAVPSIMPTVYNMMSFLAFNLLCAPCFAAIGAIRREMSSGKWTAFALIYQTVFAYAIALMINQFGALISGNVNIPGLIAAIIVLAVMLFMLLRPDPNKKVKELNKTASANL